MAINSFQGFFLEVQRLFAPLTLAPDQTRFFQALGWNIHTLTNGNAGNFTSLIPAVKQAVNTVESLVTDPPQTFAEFRTALNQLTTLQLNLQALPTPLVANSAVANALPGRLLNKLLVLYLRTYHPIIFEALSLLKIIDVESASTVVDATSNIVLYQAGLLPELKISRLKDFLQAPTEYLKAEYWPNGLPDQAAASATAEKIFPFIGRIAHLLGLSFQYSQPAVNKPSYLTASEWEEMRSISTLLTPMFATQNGGIALSAGMGILPATAFPADGAGFFIVPKGEINLSTRYHDSLITVDFSEGVGGIRVHENKIDTLDSTISPSVRLATSIKPLLKSAKPVPAFVIGSPTNTRLELGFYSIRAFLTKSEQANDLGIAVDLQQVSLVLASADADSFLSKVLKSLGTAPVIEFDISIAWTKRRGLHLSGSGNLEASITLPNSGSSQPVLRFGKLLLGIRADTNGFKLYAATDAAIRLGPVVANIERFGIGAALQDAEVGNFGSLDATLQFETPRGVGISIDSDTLKGGGYLYFNSSAHQYAGIAALTFRDKLNLNAIGLLQTQLPNKPEGYSLLLLITAEFSPVQLGLGFTLSGVGGLVGLHRAANTPALQAMVRQGRLNTLLFPTNILASPAAALATADAAFPATEDRHVFGLLAKIGWGTPKTLITLDLALIVELPAPIRLIILGSLRAILPSEENDVLRLRADFLGVVDFGTKTASFDASLVDSRLLAYALSGDMAFRLQWGETSVFLLSVGGFHPAFQPPAAAHLPTLRRLTLALADSKDFQLRFTAYLALTSNTVQFGAGVYLYAAIAGDYYLEGHLSLDTLVQVSPFQLLVLLSAGLAVKRNGKTKLGLTLDLSISGPAPWHVQGEATFKIIVKFTVKINRTFGASAPAPALPDVDVTTLLQQALTQPQSWEGVLPAAQPTAGVVVRAKPTTGTLLLAPNATLQVRQQLLPLGLELQRYGQGRPTGGSTRFDVQSLTLGTGTTARTLQGVQLEELQDPFAPGQYRDLSDAERLSVPSFQPMRSGVRLRAQGYTGGEVVNQALTYAQVILRRQATSTRPADGYSDQFTSAPAHRQRTPVATITYQQLAHGGTLAQAMPALPAVTAPPQVGWKQETYAVVRTADLALHRPGAGRFLNQAEAQAYLQDQLRTDASLTDQDLLVLPTYQLE